MNRAGNGIHRSIMGLIGMLPDGLIDAGCKAYLRALRARRGRLRVRTQFGALLDCDPYDYVQGYILLFGTWEPEVSLAIQRCLRPGDTFVDIGANVGYDTLLGATAVGDRGSVIAIEAAAGTMSLLESNLSLNPELSRRVRAVHAAVSDRRGTLALYELSGNHIGATTTVRSRGGTPSGRVEALPLGDILRADEASRTTLIKIDVEGAERPILESIIADLHRFPRLRHVIVEASVEDDLDAWKKLLGNFVSHGFRPHAIENEYSYRWYVRPRTPVEPRELLELPQTQTDLLLTR